MSIKLGNSTKDAEKLWYVDNAGDLNAVSRAWYVDDALMRHLIFAGGLPPGTYRSMAYNPHFDEYLVLDTVGQVIRAADATTGNHIPEHDITSTNWGTGRTAIVIAYGALVSAYGGFGRIPDDPVWGLGVAMDLGIASVRVDSTNYGTRVRTLFPTAATYADSTGVSLYSEREREGVGSINPTETSNLLKFRSPLPVRPSGFFFNGFQQSNTSPSDMAVYNVRNLVLIGDSDRETLFAYSMLGEPRPSLNQDVSTLVTTRLNAVARAGYGNFGGDLDTARILDDIAVKSHTLTFPNTPFIPAIPAETGAPAAVTNLAATRTASTNQVRITWTASTGATSYDWVWVSPYNTAQSTTTGTVLTIPNAGWGPWLIVVAPRNAMGRGAEARITPTFTVDPIVVSPLTGNDLTPRLNAGTYTGRINPVITTTTQQLLRTVCNQYGTQTTGSVTYYGRVTNYFRIRPSDSWSVVNTRGFVSAGPVRTFDTRGTSTGATAVAVTQERVERIMAGERVCVNETTRLVTETTQSIVRQGSTVTVTGISSDRAGNAFDLSAIQATTSPSTYDYITHIDRDDLQYSDMVNYQSDNTSGALWTIPTVGAQPKGVATLRDTLRRRDYLYLIGGDDGRIYSSTKGINDTAFGTPSRIGSISTVNRPLADDIAGIGCNASYVVWVWNRDVPRIAVTTPGNLRRDLVQERSYALNPENSAPIDVTVSSRNVFYVLDQSGQCFAYQLSSGNLVFRENLSFNYHQAAADTRIPRKHTLVGNLGFRILFSDGLTRFQALVA